MTVLKTLIRSVYVSILLVSCVYAHGINGHINVTHWMTSDVATDRVWRQPDCRNAMVFGSAFPDTGYGVNHEYGEITHWAPFLDALIDHLRSSDPTTQSDLLTRCFVVGLAVHGLQDEMFDTFFLEQVTANDAVGQDIVDPGLDAIMVVDGVARIKPEIYVPEFDVMHVLRESFSIELDASLLAEAARRVKLAVIDHFAPIAEQYAANHRDDLGWASEHYLDDTVIGSLGSEIEPTGAYGAAVWSRLNGDPLNADIVSSFGGYFMLTAPPDERRVYGLVLSRAVRVGSIHGGIAARQKGGTDVEYLAVEPGIWTQSDDQYTRVIRLEVAPSRDLNGFEFSAPMDWEWVDNERSVGNWFSLVEEVSPSPAVSMYPETVSNSSCMSAEGHPSPRACLLAMLLILGFAVSRLKA